MVIMVVDIVVWSARNSSKGHNSGLFPISGGGHFYVAVERREKQKRIGINPFSFRSISMALVEPE